MRYDISQLVKDLDGTDLRGPDNAVVTYGDLMVRALINAQLPGDADRKYGIYKLATTISAARGEIDIGVKDVNTIRDCASNVLTTLPFGRLADFLENPMPPPEGKSAAGKKKAAAAAPTP